MLWVTIQKGHHLFVSLLSGSSKWLFVKSSQCLSATFETLSGCCSMCSRAHVLATVAGVAEFKWENRRNCNSPRVDVRSQPVWLCTHSRCWYIWTELFTIRAEGFLLPGVPAKPRPVSRWAEPFQNERLGQMHHNTHASSHLSSRVVFVWYVLQLVCFWAAEILHFQQKMVLPGAEQK